MDAITLLVACLCGLTLGGIARFMLKSTASRRLVNANPARRLVISIGL